MRRKWPHPTARKAWFANNVHTARGGRLPRSVLPAYALRSVVGTLSLSTSATEAQPGLFSCAFVRLVSVMSVDNELLRVNVEAVAGAALNCVLCLCHCRTAS